MSFALTRESSFSEEKNNQSLRNPLLEEQVLPSPELHCIQEIFQEKSAFFTLFPHNDPTSALSTIEKWASFTVEIEDPITKEESRLYIQKMDEIILSSPNIPQELCQNIAKMICVIEEKHQILSQFIRHIFQDKQKPAPDFCSDPFSLDSYDQIQKVVEQFQWNTYFCVPGEYRGALFSMLGGKIRAYLREDPLEKVSLLIQTGALSFYRRLNPFLMLDLGPKLQDLFTMSIEKNCPAVNREIFDFAKEWISLDSYSLAKISMKKFYPEPFPLVQQMTRGQIYHIRLRVHCMQHREAYKVIAVVFTCLLVIGTSILLTMGMHSEQ